MQCSGAPTGVTRVDTVGSVGSEPSIVIGTDGLPIISYYDSTNSHPRVAKCANASCSGNSITQIDSDVSEQYIAMAVGSDGLPVIAYWEQSLNDLKVFKCANAVCRAP